MSMHDPILIDDGGSLRIRRIFAMPGLTGTKGQEFKDLKLISVAVLAADSDGTLVAIGSGVPKHSLSIKGSAGAEVNGSVNASQVLTLVPSKPATETTAGKDFRYVVAGPDRIDSVVVDGEDIAKGLQGNPRNLVVLAFDHQG